MPGFVPLHRGKGFGCLCASETFEESLANGAIGHSSVQKVQRFCALKSQRFSRSFESGWSGVQIPSTGTRETSTYGRLRGRAAFPSRIGCTGGDTGHFHPLLPTQPATGESAVIALGA